MRNFLKFFRSPAEDWEDGETAYLKLDDVPLGHAAIKRPTVYVYGKWTDGLKERLYAERSDN